ncbi:MAG: hypothetical protein F6K31_19265 [Symploca sp. SIO2G7]|nr:hypothetical protein [Symploca sp. SIO2G7]
MESKTKHPLLTELTADQAATVNGGNQLRFHYSRCYHPRVRYSYHFSSQPQSTSFKVAANRLDSVLFD